MREPETQEEYFAILGLTVEALLWISHYESWILDEVGVDYRKEAIREGRHHRSKVEYLPLAWSSLACELQALLPTIVSPAQ